MTLERNSAPPQSPQWRIERSKHEDWIQKTYETTRRYITENPFNPNQDDETA